MISDASSAGVKSNALSIGLAIGITYFIEMYQSTSAAVSRGFIVRTIVVRVHERTYAIYSQFCFLTCTAAIVLVDKFALY